MALHGNLRAIAAMVAACAMFACMDALLKALAGSYPPLQVAALRGLTAMPLVCLYVLWRRQLGAVFARGLAWRLHLLRGAVTLLMLALFTYGLKTLGLAEAYTLTFIAPMVITMLSVPMLKERVPPRHWAAIAVGLCGVVVALRPEQGAFLSLGGGLGLVQNPFEREDFERHLAQAREAIGSTAAAEEAAGASMTLGDAVVYAREES